MAEEINLAGLLRPGDRLAWSAGPVKPAHLLGVLDRQLDRTPRVSAVLNVSFQTTVDAARLASRATVTALGGAVTNRRFQEIGALDVLPINYSAMPDLVTSGRLPIDVVLLQLAADSGDFNLSLMVDHVADAVPRARVVVAEINDLLPVTFGETRIEAVDVDHVAHVSRPPFEVASRASRAIEHEIAAHVCRLIGDGATLQISLGSLPDAVLESLTTKRDLGLRSGTLDDRVVDLVEAGVISNRKKSIPQRMPGAAGLIRPGRPWTVAWVSARLSPFRRCRRRKRRVAAIGLRPIRPTPCGISISFSTSPDCGSTRRDGDAVGASDLFSRAKGAGPPQEQPCSGEIVKLGHGNAAQRQCRRVIAQRDTIQGAKGINRYQATGACCDQ